MKVPAIISVLMLGMAVSYGQNGQLTNSSLEESILCGEDDHSKNKKLMTFGFGLGINRSNLAFSSTSNGEQITNGMGYRLGVISEIRMGRRFSFSPKAELSFNASRLNQDDVNYNVNATNLEFMGHLRYMLFRTEFSPYIIAGPNARIVLNGENSQNYIPTKNDVAIDVGAGLDIPLKWFTMAPEIRYSFGLTDIQESTSNVSDLKFNNIALVLIFKD